MVPTGFTGQLLDRYLASGWYRMGSKMFTCRYNFYEWGFLSTVWTRLPLHGHSFPKRLAKTMRRNNRALRFEIHDAQATTEEERVFTAYKTEKKYDLHATAGYYIKHNRNVPFDTKQVSIFFEDELIAFSYFDVGDKAAQSLCGFYNPDFKQYSLGVYTMAIEIDHCRSIGMEYHYAGYIVPGNDVFEYKRKFGELECFDDKEHVWFPIADLDRDALPSTVQAEAMREYNLLLRSLQMSYTLRLRPEYFISISQQSMQWLRREQFPFCITEHRSNQRPFWACHFYSYNRQRYFSLLCKSHFDPPTDTSAALLNLVSSPPYKHEGSGVAVRVLHSQHQPYTAADLERVWAAVDRANRQSNFDGLAQQD